MQQTIQELLTQAQQYAIVTTTFGAHKTARCHVLYLVRTSLLCTKPFLASATPNAHVTASVTTTMPLLNHAFCAHHTQHRHVRKPLLCTKSFQACATPTKTVPGMLLTATFRAHYTALPLSRTHVARRHFAPNTSRPLQLTPRRTLCSTRTTATHFAPTTWHRHVRTSLRCTKSFQASASPTRTACYCHYDLCNAFFTRYMARALQRSAFLSWWRFL